MAPAITRADPVAEVVRNLVSPAVSGVVALPVMCDRIALASVATAGGAFAWQNPLDVKVLATVVVDITAAAPATRTLDIGPAADATTLSDTILDGIAADAVAVYNGASNAGVNGRMFRKVDEKGGTNDYITGSSVGGGALTGLAGFAYIIYVPIS